VNTEQIISSGLLEAYVMGNTTPIESAQVEQFRLQYPEVNNEILAIEETMEAYAFANAITPSHDIKNKISMALQMPTQTVLPNNISKVVTLSPWRNIAAASIALLIGSAIFNVLYFSKYKNANAKYAESEKAIATLNANLSESSNDMNVIRSKYSLPLKLKPDIAPKDADAKIYWLTNTGEIYIDPSNLPATPKGMQYQLWAIVDGKAIDAGLIVSKDGTLKMQKMKTFGKAQAFAVTLEVEGGVIASKEKPYVIVSL
jgi:outer membrane murein-binding lipoprotein Lpp